MAWSDVRNRLLASEAFHRFAAWFPLTRPIAQREAKNLFDLVAGFVYSQILYACVKLNLFKLLANGPLSLHEIAKHTNLSEESALRLLAAAQSLRLMEDRGNNTWGLGMLGAVMVTNTAVAALVEHHATLYADLRDPIALLRGETDPSMAKYWPYANEHGASPLELTEEKVAEYSQLMSASQPLIASEILSAYSFSKHKKLLDIGGGQGTFLMAAAQKAPHLQLMLFDLPAVASLAQKNFDRAGISARATAHGGSFFETALPRGGDIASIIRVLYDHDDHRALAILKAAHRALSSGCTLLVAEPMSGTRGAEAMGDAYFGFYLLAMGKGKSRSAQRLIELIREAGFVDCQLQSTRLPLQTRLITARRA
jgi:demethylspheroidene O-methyltransferase